MKKLPLMIAALLAIAIGFLALRTQSCSLQPCIERCDLPAPDTVFVDVTSSTSAKLRWSEVTDAVGYRILVKDLDSNTIFLDTITGGIMPIVPNGLLSFNLTGLTPSTEYAATVQAVCSTNVPSIDPGPTCFSTPNIIVGEEVVMMDCGNCVKGIIVNSIPLNAPYSRTWAWGGAQDERTIYHFRVRSTTSTNEKSFYLAYDRSCDLILFDGTTCSDKGMQAILESNQKIKIVESGNPILTIWPTHIRTISSLSVISSEMRISFDNGTNLNDCSVGYWQCISDPPYRGCN
ncbi:MAG: fibronectin type III domain-containing protein [Saprospiraceae bacterium]|nr:fibronectin type III domain-containing protein [Saprospiraceae bacterium]